MLKQLWGKVIEEEHSLPSYVEARSWKFFVFLLFLIKQWNNSSCASHFTLRLVFFPDCVFVHVVPLERSAAGISLFHSNYEISLHKNSD